MSRFGFWVVRGFLTAPWAPRQMLIALSCGALSVSMASPAFAKQKSQLSQCSHYSECMKDVRPYCRKDAAGEPAETRAAAYAACFARYESTCREVNCD